MRRRAGVSGIAHANALDAKFRELAVERARFREEETRKQLGRFTRALEGFAARHRTAIRADPLFRAEFHQMCAAVGVDPLASRKSAWARALGLGEFYVELAVCVVERCLASRAHDGGLCELDVLVRRVNSRRGSAVGDVSADDVERAIESLASLGGGWRVETTSGTKMVRSVPLEMSDDVTVALTRARATGEGYITASALAEASEWTFDRARDALEAALRLGVALADDQSPTDTERAYWFPAFRDDLTGE